MRGVALTTLLEHIQRVGLAVLIAFFFEHELYSLCIGVGFFLLLDEIAGTKE